MQHDLFGSLRDLDLRSNPEVDLSRSSYISKDSPSRDKHDGTNTILPSLKLQSLLVKEISGEYTRFQIRWPLKVKPLTLVQIWRHLNVRKFHWISSVVLRFALACKVSKIMKAFWSNVRLRQNFRKFCDFWPLETPFWVGVKKTK